MATARKSGSARSSQRKYSPKAKSGGRTKVKSRKQAIAIGISEARKSGAKVPPKKTA
ncbi:MAG: DUF6496 domain-containing protein [Candidatus Korobacteraceae bacterium]